MSATKDARHLSGADLGRHITAPIPGGKYAGPWQLDGTIIGVKHFASGDVQITAQDQTQIRFGVIPGTQPVTITGATR
ncbi:hypothetical protein [Glutamicibacter sp. PS]|uniref:hypothetical protein n=1 Tax=Glutamicibacter sp. PS TaxID=3075634 RepID=UPI00283E39E6|nr:hypothetical protein [Glutamicibacter sp. PS]MDR4533226.1 hypothetical protein [Glutamicibacter sp. PS]